MRLKKRKVSSVLKLPFFGFHPARLIKRRVSNSRSSEPKRHSWLHWFEDGAGSPSPARVRAPAIILEPLVASQSGTSNGFSVKLRQPLVQYEPNKCIQLLFFATIEASTFGLKRMGKRNWYIVNSLMSQQEDRVAKVCPPKAPFTTPEPASSRPTSRGLLFGLGRSRARRPLLTRTHPRITPRLKSNNPFPFQ